jgi:hypothetical protein
MPRKQTLAQAAAKPKQLPDAVPSIKDSNLRFGFKPQVGKYAPSNSQLLPEIGRFLLFTITATSISAIISTLTEPFTDAWSDGLLKDTTWGQIALLTALRAFHSWLTLHQRLSPLVSTLFLTYVRLPYYLFIFLFSDVTVPTVAISLLNESVSTYVAALSTLTFTTSHPDTLHNRVFIKNKTSVVLLAFFTNLLLAVPLTLLSSLSFLPAYAVRSFYPLHSLTRAYDLPLSYAAALLLPASAIVPYLVAKPHGSNTPETTLGRALVLAAATALDAGTRIVVSVSGASAVGAQVYAMGWALATIGVGAGIRWVEGVVPDEEADKKVVLAA